jgi:hypothetical protein
MLPHFLCSSLHVTTFPLLFPACYHISFALPCMLPHFLCSFLHVITFPVSSARYRGSACMPLELASLCISLCMYNS